MSSPAPACKEDAKNMALLFFMDHLMQKNGARSIHDLSCQFGARGFSAEMREAVGGTQEGLQDFLASYPSLFKVEGDTVAINAYGDLALGGGKANPLAQTLGVRDRDYVKEAIEFFEIKLQKFGPELQIKSLLGHRSQAAPEVRLVSGRHVKDFTDFLAGCTEHFIVEGDRVRLAKLSEPTLTEWDIDENGQVLSGAKAKQTAVDFMKDTLEAQDTAPMPLDVLYQRFCERFSHVVRQEVATNPKELLSFLKLNRAIFFIRSNKVSLVKNRSDSPSIASSTEGGDTESVGSGTKEENYMDQIIVLKSLKPAQEAVQEIVSGGLQQLESPVVAVDFKIVSLGPPGSPEFFGLVVVKDASERIYIFDLAHSDSILLESGLKDLIEAEEWTKVMHDSARVSSILLQQYGISLQSIFDTQIANAVLQHQKNGKPVDEVKAISFYHLQRLYCPQSLMKTDFNPRKLQKPDSNFWSVRPLSEESIKLAVEEVRVMLPSMFQLMKESMKPELTVLFEQLCRVQTNAHQRKGDIKQPIRRDHRKARPPVYKAQSEDEEKQVQSSLEQFNSFGIRENGVAVTMKTNGFGSPRPVPERKMVDSATQTLSTGEITMTKVYYDG